MEKNIFNKQHDFYQTGVTLTYKYRVTALRKLKETIIKYESEITNALYADLGKSAHEAYVTEIGFAINELNHTIKHLKKWMKPKKVHTPMTSWFAKSYIIPDPYGQVLIIAPWNYPFLLTISPLMAAIAGGNTVIIKPSEYSINTSMIINKIISEAYNESYIKVFNGDSQVASNLLDLPFNFIFFTGSCRVGKIVLTKAAEHLTPVCLELGGKSPCLVLDDASIDITSRRIIFGKLLNSGQTCVAPDYIYVDKKIKDALVTALIKEITLQYTNNPIENVDYGKIIDKSHYERLIKLIDPNKVVTGGNGDGIRINPTILDNITFEDDIMQEEIFGPILPIITFDNIDEALAKINSLPQPLAFYLFTSNKKNKEIMKKVRFGGGCINDTIMHLVNLNLPFGGSGNSGMGRYHGVASFKCFTKEKAIVDKALKFDILLRYPPYTKKKTKIVKKVFK